MMRRGSMLAICVVTALTAAACDEAVTAPEPALTPAQTEAIAPQFDALSSDALMGFAHAFLHGPAGHFGVPGNGSTTFTRTVTCPKGGELKMEGSSQRTVDRETKTVTGSSTVTKTHVNCAFQARDAVVTLNGNPNVVTKSSHKMVDGKPSGPQVTTHKGSFKWSRGEASGTCDVDLTSTLDPEAKKVTLKGTFCGRAIDQTRDWPGQRQRG